MKRKIVTLNNLFSRYAVFMLVVLVVLAISQVMGVRIALLTVERNQFRYIQELECYESLDDSVHIALKYFTLLAGLIFCYLTRHVDAKLSNVRPISECKCCFCLMLLFR